MNFNIRGENVEVTEAIRNYVESKVKKVSKYFSDEVVSQVYVNFKVYKSGSKVEVTIPMPKLVLRAEEVHNDLYAAIDLVVDKLERQIRKHKTKVNRKQREKGFKQDFFISELSEITSQIQEEEHSDAFDIRREKEFELFPMDAEEAILQMNMLGHDFFLFLDEKTGRTSAVYNRGNNTYGLIKTL